jgi:hypothetical protein
MAGRTLLGPAVGAAFGGGGANPAAGTGHPNTLFGRAAARLEAKRAQRQEPKAPMSSAGLISAGTGLAVRLAGRRVKAAAAAPAATAPLSTTLGGGY